MSTLIGAPPGKLPDGTSTTTNAGGQIVTKASCRVLACSNTPVGPMAAGAAVTLALPTMLQGDYIEVEATWTSDAANSGQIQVNLNDGVTNYSCGISGTNTANSRLNCKWQIFVDSTNNVRGMRISDTSTTNIASIVTAAVAITSMTQIILLFTGANNYTLQAYCIKLYRFGAMS